MSCEWKAQVSYVEDGEYKNLIHWADFGRSLTLDNLDSWLQHLVSLRAQYILYTFSLQTPLNLISF